MSEKSPKEVSGKTAESLLEVIKRVGQNIGKSSLVEKLYITLKYNIEW